jgi:DNA primase
MNILDLIESDGFVLKKKANTYGGEWAGPCPFCGGTDRFLVWPNDKGGRYWCRQCKKHGDDIQYMRDFQKLTYYAACRCLRKTPKTRSCSVMPVKEARPIFKPKETAMPTSSWSEKAQEFLERCQSCLWSDQGALTRDFLHREKGLSDETIKSAGLGFNPDDIFLERLSWGLPAELRDDGKPKKLWLPEGLVLPRIDSGYVIRLSVRRGKHINGQRYIVIPGSASRSMVHGMDKKVIVVIESELDGLLLNQEVGDFVGVVALGSAQAKPDEKTHNVLQMADTVLVALDSDKAGAQAAWLFWSKTYGNKTVRWPCVKGKDPSDAWQNGLDIRAWVLTGLEYLVSSFLR